MSNFLFFRLLPVLCLCVALLFAGCGEDEDDSVEIDDSADVIAAEEPSGPNILEGKITEDMTLTASREHILKGAVFVENNGATLTIEPGTTIYGEGEFLTPHSDYCTGGKDYGRRNTGRTDRFHERCARWFTRSRTVGRFDY